MAIHNIYAVWRIAFTLLALSTNGLVSAMRAKLTDHESQIEINHGHELSNRPITFAKIWDKLRLDKVDRLDSTTVDSTD